MFLSRFDNLCDFKGLQKFFRGQIHMFKESKRCAQLRALQGTDFRGHTTSESFFISGKTKKLKIWRLRALEADRMF